MREILLSLTAMIAALCLPPAMPAFAQGGDVEGELFLESVIDPTQDETNNVTLNDQPKAWSYTPFLSIVAGGPDEPGSATVDYEYDSDPFGAFVLTVQAGGAGPIDVKYQLLHDTVDVSPPGWTVRTTLTVELIDENDNGDAFIIPAADPDEEVPALMVVGAAEDDGILETYVRYPTLTLGALPNLQEPDTYFWDSGEMAFLPSDPVKAMGIQGEFQLSPGDKAIVSGRFEIYSSVPVEDTSVGALKAKFQD